jgi:hypothetical protein
MEGSSLRDATSQVQRFSNIYKSKRFFRLCFPAYQRPFIHILKKSDKGKKLYTKNSRQKSPEKN